MATKSNNATAANSAVLRDGFVNVAREAREAESAVGEALRGALEYAANNGRFEPAELEAAGYATGTAKVYASEWNRAAAVAAIMGKARTVKLLRDEKALGATGEPKAYRAMLAVLRAAQAQAKADGIKGEATTRQASAIIKALPQVVATRHANKAEKATRAPKAPSPAKLAEAAVESMAGPKSLAASVRLMANQATRFAEPEGREAEWRKAVKALQDASEALAVFAK